MKKKIFGAVLVVAIAVGAMINVNLNKTSNKGDLAMANVEALAQAEPDEHWFEEMVITPLYNFTGKLHVSYKGVSIELASANYGLCGFWKNCEGAWFGTCDRSQQGFQKL
jgi:hypothetical protein